MRSGVVLGSVCLVALLIAGPVGSSDAYTPDGAKVVLKNGEEIEARSATINGERITLHFANGTSRSYRRSAVDFNASDGITVGDPAPRKRSKKNDLSGVAGSIKLNKNGTTDPDGITIVGPGSVPEDEPLDDSYLPGRPYRPHIPNYGTRKGDDANRRVQRSASYLSARIRGLMYTQSDAEGRCSGSQWVGQCGGRFLAPRNTTDECKNAISRARQEISSVRRDFRQLKVLARQEGLDPGDLRTILSTYGLINVESTLDQASRRLDALVSQGPKT